MLKEKAAYLRRFMYQDTVCMYILCENWLVNSSDSFNQTYYLLFTFKMFKDNLDHFTKTLRVDIFKQQYKSFTD